MPSTEELDKKRTASPTEICSHKLTKEIQKISSLILRKKGEKRKKETLDKFWGICNNCQNKIDLVFR